MRTTRHDEIVSRVYSARIGAMEALKDVGAHNASRLREAATALRSSGQIYNAEIGTHPYEMFAELMDVSALLVEWKDVVLNAAMDADRFLRAAQVKCRTWADSAVSATAPEGLRRFAADVLHISDLTDVSALILRLTD